MTQPTFTEEESGLDRQIIAEVIHASRMITENGHWYDPSPNEKLMAYATIRAAKIAAVPEPRAEYGLPVHFTSTVNPYGETGGAG